MTLGSARRITVRITMTVAPINDYDDRRTQPHHELRQQRHPRQAEPSTSCRALFSEPSALSRAR